MRSVTLLDQIVLEFLADPQVIEPPSRPKKKKKKWDLALGKVLLDLHQLRGEVNAIISNNPKMTEKRKRELTSAYDVTYFGLAGEIAKD